LVYGLAGSTNTWIGASGTGSDTSTFTWSDSTALLADWTYDNWSSNRPKDKKNWDCVKMEKDGEWTNFLCTKAYQFVCSMEATNLCETTTTFAPTTAAPSSGAA